MTIPLFPSAPYPDPSGEMTGGWAGSATSRARALADMRLGITSARQRRIMEMLAAAADFGVTWFEVAKELGLHHGQATGPLSNLHQSGWIVRLKETRGKCEIYVLPEYTLDRDLSPYRPVKANREALAEYERGLADGRAQGHRDGFMDGYDAAVKALKGTHPE